MRSAVCRSLGPEARKLGARQPAPGRASACRKRSVERLPSSSPPCSSPPPLRASQAEVSRGSRRRHRRGPRRRLRLGRRRDRLVGGFGLALIASAALGRFDAPRRPLGHTRRSGRNRSASGRRHADPPSADDRSRASGAVPKEIPMSRTALVVSLSSLVLMLALPGTAAADQPSVSTVPISFARIDAALSWACGFPVFITADGERRITTFADGRVVTHRKVREHVVCERKDGDELPDCHVHRRSRRSNRGRNLFGIAFPARDSSSRTWAESCSTSTTRPSSSSRPGNTRRFPRSARISGLDARCRVRLSLRGGRRQPR